MCEDWSRTHNRRKRRRTTPTSGGKRQRSLWDPDEAQKVSPWLLRIEIDKQAYIDKNLAMQTIAERIAKDWGNDLHIIWSDDNAEQLILQIRIKNDDENKSRFASSLCAIPVQ